MELTRFWQRTKAAWTALNPTLKSGEPGVEFDTKRWKVGDGYTAWTSLPYWGNPRVETIVTNANPRINTDLVDVFGITGQTGTISSFTTNLMGTPVNGQSLHVYITGTAARAITWGASFEAGVVALPTTTTLTQRLDVLFVWNTATSKWRCIASGTSA